MNNSDEPSEPVTRRCRRDHLIPQGVPEGLCPKCMFGDPGDDEEDTEDEGESAKFPVRFGRYELHKKLGEGGEGVVYQARRLRGLGQVVALKRIRDGGSADPSTRRRFLAEARAAAELRHPNIVPIYDVGEHKGEPYFTMRLLPGGTLAQAAKRFAEPQRAAALVAKLARAVFAGHKKHILHRDLKPANILFDEHGEPSIADFGVAKRLDHSGTASTNAIQGTPLYMAPEQVTDHAKRNSVADAVFLLGAILGELIAGRRLFSGATTTARAGSPPYMAPEQVTPHAKRNSVAADVWSLGVILYELIAGHRPFSGATEAEVIRSVVYEEPEPLEHVRPGVDRDLATICLTCLQKEPERRYLSAEALAEDLERYLRGERALARRPSLVLRVVRSCKRHPAISILFGAAALALVTLTASAFISAREQEAGRRNEVLASNVFAARAIAGTVLAELREYADIVAEEAREPSLVHALAEGDDDVMARLCNAVRARHRSGKSALGWWFVMDKDGYVRALAPTATFGKTYYLNFSFRDYFRSAKALPADAKRPVYVSRAFFSTNDEEYKVAIASPIRGADGVFAGLLVATLFTDRRLGALALSDDRRNAVLTVRRDRDVTTPFPPNQHLLLAHDGVAQGEGVVVESEALRRLTARRDEANVPLEERLHLPPIEWVESQDDYIDPLATPAPDGTRGRWLAGIAPVGSTEISVIVQTRVEDATALDQTAFRVLIAWSAVGAALLLLAVLFAALRTRKRSRAGQASTHPSTTP